MRTLKYLIFGVLIFSVGLNSCTKPTPQLPSNKNTNRNTTVQTMLEMNKVLALKEDSVIQAMVDEQAIPYIKSKSGIWYSVIHATNSDSLKNDSIVSFSYTLYNLEGTEILSEKKSVRLGKKEIPTGLEDGLRLMRKGETIRLIVPWYLAYGMKGNEDVPPYTSLMFVIVNETTSPPAPSRSFGKGELMSCK